MSDLASLRVLVIVFEDQHEQVLLCQSPLLVRVARSLAKDE